MSQENVDSFKRGLDAYNRRDLDTLETLADVEWRPATALLLSREHTVFRGHHGVRESIQEDDDSRSNRPCAF